MWPVDDHDAHVIIILSSGHNIVSFNVSQLNGSNFGDNKENLQLKGGSLAPLMEQNPTPPGFKTKTMVVTLRKN